MPYMTKDDLVLIFILKSTNFTSLIDNLDGCQRREFSIKLVNGTTKESLSEFAKFVSEYSEIGKEAREFGYSYLELELNGFFEFDGLPNVIEANRTCLTTTSYLYQGIWSDSGSEVLLCLRFPFALPRTTYPFNQARYNFITHLADFMNPIFGWVDTYESIYEISSQAKTRYNLPYSTKSPLLIIGRENPMFDHFISNIDVIGNGVINYHIPRTEEYVLISDYTGLGNESLGVFGYDSISRKEAGNGNYPIIVENANIINYHNQRIAEHRATIRKALGESARLFNREIT